MTLRVRLHRFEGNTAQAAPPGPDGPAAPDILGFPAEPDDEDDGEGDEDDGESIRAGAPAAPLVVLRRRDPVAGVALLGAGGAAAASLVLPWTHADGALGASLMRDGLEAPGFAALLEDGPWPPVAVVAAGTALLLAGLLPWRRARTHRVAGVLALAAAAPAVAGVLVLLAEAGWDAGRVGAGAWCAAAVAGLGLLGSLKAMLTLPRITAAAAGDLPPPG
ncbi:hypothetical protein [Trujillonella humicola]|uniref:hypothetical protein n=1 Tax=Trujillonella humicola TaxID=3383699 RepID=UPI003905D8D8